MLILDSERACLQGTDSDSEGGDEIDEDQGRKSVVNGFDSKQDL